MGTRTHDIVKVLLFLNHKNQNNSASVVEKIQTKSAMSGHLSFFES